MSESLYERSVELERPRLGELKNQAMALRQVREIEWKPLGACRTENPDIFYSDKPEDIMLAKKICATCIVQTNCLRYALDLGEEHGIWGGMESRELRTLKRIRVVKQPRFND